MLVKSISIWNKYSLYNGDGEWKAAVQAVSRNLTGKCEKEHDKLIKDTRGWGAAGANKHKEIIQKLCQKVFKKKGYENQKDATRDGLHYQGNNHREAVKRLIEINDSLPFMCKGGKKFDNEDLYRHIIFVTLHLTAHVKFLRRGGRNRRDEDKVLDLLEEIQDGIEAEMQIKHANRHRNNNTSKTMTTRARTTTTAIIRTGAARRAIITNGTNAKTIRSQKNTSTATTASVGTNEAETDLGTTTDGARGTISILSVWGQVIYIFSFVIFYAWFGMLLKGRGERFLLIKDEPLSFFGLKRTNEYRASYR